MPPSARRLAPLLALALLAGCGSARDAADRPPPVTAAPPVGSVPAPGLDPKVLPPRRVPTHVRHAADPGARRVIEAWLRDLREGRLEQAARRFAVPMTFQNGTAVEHLRTATAVRAAVGGFPCGAVAYRYGAAGRYTLVRFRLTERVGGDCHGAAGHTTGGAIRVAHGRIAEWYRLYDPEEVHPAGPLVDPGKATA